jgi:hypothetical protein
MPKPSLSRYLASGQCVKVRPELGACTRCEHYLRAGKLQVDTGTDTYYVDTYDP